MHQLFLSIDIIYVDNHLKLVTKVESVVELFVQLLEIFKVVACSF